MLSNGFDCIAPKAVAGKPRTKIVATITGVAKVFFRCKIQNYYQLRQFKASRHNSRIYHMLSF